ncbi:MAG: hypothetical protein Q9165_008157 [Trypethelium subeluteriae]
MPFPTSDPIEIIVVCAIAPGKLSRFENLVYPFIAYVQQSEPDTLTFRLVSTTNSDAPLVTFIESYASIAAVELHSKSKEFAELMQKATKEKLLVENPQRIIGTASGGFVRVKDIKWVEAFEQGGGLCNF